MKDFLHALGLLCLCLLLVRPAHAFVDPPWITPEHPQAGETVYVNLRSGICDVFEIAPNAPEITQVGSAVRILLWSGHYTDPIQCTYPIESGAIAIGSFPPGSYTLQVDRNFASYTATYPGVTSLLGYAYPATDTDGDGLPDGFEYAVGTSPMIADSDGDGLSDAHELPMVGVPVTDPCSGATGENNCPGAGIFEDGFDT